MKRIALVSLCVLLLAAAGQARSVRRPGGLWDNFEAGSWVVTHTKTTTPDKTDEQRIKMTIVHKTDDRPFVLVAREVNGTFANLGQPKRQIPGFGPDQLGMTHDKAGSDRLTIEGTNHDCRTDLYRSHDRKRDLTRKLKLWRSASVTVPEREIIVDRGANVALGPHVVRAEYTVTLGRRTTSYHLELTSVATPVEVGTKTLRCIVEKGTADVRDGQERSTVRTQRWLSREVPGHIVMTHGTYEGEDARVQKVERVESFEVVTR